MKKDAYLKENYEIFYMRSSPHKLQRSCSISSQYSDKREVGKLGIWNVHKIIERRWDIEVSGSDDWLEIADVLNSGIPRKVSEALFNAVFVLTLKVVTVLFSQEVIFRNLVCCHLYDFLKHSTIQTYAGNL